MAEEKALELEKKMRDTMNLRADLLNQIGSNKSKLLKIMNQKRDVESVERKRLEDLSLSQKIEKIRKTELLRTKVDDYKGAYNSYKKVQRDLMKDSNFSFLDEGWSIEKEKIIEGNEKAGSQKQSNMECANFNQRIKSELEETLKKAELVKESEMRDRHVMEDQHRQDLVRQKTERSRKQENYRGEIEQQILRNAQFRKSRENYLNEQLAQINNYESHLDQIDRNESENPIDKSNPFRI